MRRFEDGIHVYYDGLSVVGLWRVRRIAGGRVNPATGCKHCEGLEVEHALLDNAYWSCPIVPRTMADAYISQMEDGEHFCEVQAATMFRVLEANSRRAFMPIWKVEVICERTGCSTDEAERQTLDELSRIDPCPAAFALPTLTFA